jgi:hypothetical protein
MNDFTDLGWHVYKGVIPESVIHDALRVINKNLFTRGMLPDEVWNYTKNSNWFPWLNYKDEILAIEKAFPSDLRSGQLCDPQILLHVPDTEHYVITTHKDKPPEWAEGRNYERIVGVPLTRSYREDGGLLVAPLTGYERLVAVELDPGDVVCFNPLLPYTSGMNRMGTIRYALYFRYLEDL